MTKEKYYSIKNNILSLNEVGAQVEFTWPIADVIQFDDVLVVRLEPSPGSCFNENVFGISKSGNVIWTIAPVKHVYEDSPYTGILKKGNFIKLFNWDGDELVVDPESGVIVEKGYGK